VGPEFRNARSCLWHELNNAVALARLIHLASQGFYIVVDIVEILVCEMQQTNDVAHLKILKCMWRNAASEPAAIAEMGNKAANQVAFTIVTVVTEDLASEDGGAILGVSHFSRSYAMMVRGLQPSNRLRASLI